MNMWRAGIADLLLGIGCAGCGLSGITWCSECATEVTPEPFEVEPGMWAAGRWQGRLRSAILAWKLGQVAHMDRLLAWHIAASFLFLDPPESCVLVPVPTTWRSRRERGRHIVLDLCQEAATMLRSQQLDVRVEQSVRLSRQTKDQSALTARMRAHNVRGSMRIRRIPMVPVVIVDDIVTTGATLAEMRRVLENAGADVIGCVSIAASINERHVSAQ